MNRKLSVLMYCMFIALAAPRVSHGAPSSSASGWIVGSATFGGSTLGATGGFVGGAALGSMGCGDMPHRCGLAPLALGVLGAGVGAAITTPLTTHFTAKAVGADARHVLRDVGITAGASFGMLLIGAATAWSAPVGLGVAGFAIALPIVAGVSAAKSVRARQDGIAWSVSPQVNRRTAGFTFHGSF